MTSGFGSGLVLTVINCLHLCHLHILISLVLDFSESRYCVDVKWVSNERVVGLVFHSEARNLLVEQSR